VLNPPTRLVVPIKTSNATLRGIAAEATVIEITKLPNILYSEPSVRYLICLHKQQLVH
jgi:hypothetical protein